MKFGARLKDDSKIGVPATPGITRSWVRTYTPSRKAHNSNRSSNDAMASTISLGVGPLLLLPEGPLTLKNDQESTISIFWKLSKVCDLMTTEYVGVSTGTGWYLSQVPAFLLWYTTVSGLTLSACMSLMSMLRTHPSLPG